jgi:hypothetical protein
MSRERGSPRLPVMLRWFIRRRLAAFARAYGDDLGYVREILDTDLRAFLALGRIQGFSAYRADLPADVAYAVRLTGTVAEDCGPCTQLMVAFAARDGVDGRVVRAILADDQAALSPDVVLGIRFARAVLARAPDADDHRDRIRERWGPRAVVSAAYGLTSARLYPTLKYALGHGQACRRVVVDGVPAPVARTAA